MPTKPGLHAAFTTSPTGRRVILRPVEVSRSLTSDQLYTATREWVLRIDEVTGAEYYWSRRTHQTMVEPPLIEDETTPLPMLLRKAAAAGLPVILSTGMAYLNEIKLAVAALQQGGMALEDITVLHCTSEYPAPVEMINLNAMKTISAELGTMVGYSDHSEGIEIATAAVALGANVIEKHFTIDRTMAGPDHLASLGPDDLKTMISAIRNVEVCLGNGNKVPAPCEFENRDLVRKSIVAACNIRQGEILGEHNLAVKRPGTGISPMEWDKVIGLPSPRDFEADELIKI